MAWVSPIGGFRLCYPYPPYSTEGSVSTILSIYTQCKRSTSFKYKLQIYIYERIWNKPNERIWNTITLMLSVVEYKKNKNLPKKLKSTIRKNIQQTYRVLFFCAQRLIYKLNLNTAGGYTRKLHTRYLRGRVASI